MFEVHASVAFFGFRKSNSFHSSPSPSTNSVDLQEDAGRFGGQKKVGRRGDKDNYFVGYTYKRKPSGSSSSAGARPGINLTIPTAGSASGGATTCDGGVMGGAPSGALPPRPPSSAAAAVVPPAQSPTAGASSTKKQGAKGAFTGIFGGRKGA